MRRKSGRTTFNRTDPDEATLYDAIESRSEGRTKAARSKNEAGAKA